MERTPKMEAFNESLGQLVFKNSPKECLDNETCIDCGGDATEFRDERSRNEYHISGLCQACQDKWFGEE